jgi:hypothetical protein
MSDRLEKLPDAPIVEVTCGFMFPPMAGLDPLVLGKFWDSKADAYPRHEFHPAIPPDPRTAPQGQLSVPTVIFRTGLPPQRVWLLSADDVFVIQIQADRFYVNWRARGAAYPRFSGGLLDRVLKEFSTFSDFCAATRAIGARPAPSAIQLGKVDHLLEGKHWGGVPDLAKMIPALGPFVGMRHSDDLGVMLRLSDSLGNAGESATVLEVGVLATAAGPVRVLKLETTITLKTETGGTDVRGAFVRANDAVNDTFASLIPKPERDRRFRGERA